MLLQRDNLAIHHAAMKGHSDILQMLLDAGSEINAQDKVCANECELVYVWSMKYCTCFGVSTTVRVSVQRLLKHSIAF